MSTPTTPDTPENWGAASAGYAERVAPVLMEPFVEAFIDKLGVDTETDVIEVGAGSGALTEALFPRVRSLLATDFAPKMVEMLKERMKVAGAENVRCEVMDGQALALEDRSFDAAACNFALMLFPDRAKGFSELCRVLRPGGRVMVSGWAGPDRFELLGLFVEAMNAAFPEMAAPAEQPAVFSLGDLAHFKAQMEAAGLQDVEAEFVSRDLEVGSFDGLWSMLTVGAPPVQVMFDRVGDEGRERLRESLRGIVEERFGSGPIVTTNSATLGTGTAPG